jgi:Transmembrane secretion effector
MRWSISITSTLNFDPAPVTSFSHRLIHTPRTHDGPVSITIEYQVDQSHRRKLMNILRQVRLIHLRNGAYSWQLHEDLGRQNTFRVEMAVPSWNEYLLAQEWLTKSDQEIIRMAENLHVGPVPSETRFFLCVKRELHTHRHSKETEGAASVGPMPVVWALAAPDRLRLRHGPPQPSSLPNSNPRPLRNWPNSKVRKRCIARPLEWPVRQLAFTRACGSVTCARHWRLVLQCTSDRVAFRTIPSYSACYAASSWRAPYSSSVSGRFSRQRTASEVQPV